MFLQNWNLAEIYMSTRSVRYYKIIRSRWKIEYAVAKRVSQVLHQVIRMKRIARNLLRNPGVTEKEKWDEGVVENGKDAGWRGLHFLVDDVSIPGNSTLRSQPFLRSEVISEFSRQAGLFSLFPASSRNALLRGRCESRERKQSAIPFVITSCILRVSRPLYSENKQKPNI